MVHQAWKRPVRYGVVRKVSGVLVSVTILCCVAADQVPGVMVYDHDELRWKKEAASTHLSVQKLPDTQHSSLAFMLKQHYTFMKTSYQGWVMRSPRTFHTNIYV